MSSVHESGNEATYQRLKSSIDSSYPAGWFVAIAQGQEIAAAADFRSLEDIIRGGGLDPRNVLVVEAGAQYSDHVTIFV